VAVMAKETPPAPGGVRASGYRVERFSDAGSSARDLRDILMACKQVTDGIFDGLDLELEIRSVHTQRLGDTLLVWGDSGLAAFAICHHGPGTEAGSGACYVKFAAVRPSRRAGEAFERLLDAAEDYARERRAPKITAGVNLARREAFQALGARGFRTEMQGVAMETGDASSGYNRAGIYVLDDWR